MQEKIPKNSSEAGSALDFSQLAEAIKTWGKELGFQQVRVADANADMAQLEYGLQQWLNEGYHGEIDYMAKYGTGALARRNSFRAHCAWFRLA